MRRPLLINASLLSLALLLGTLAWLSSEKPEEDKNIPLTSLSPDQINLIELENSNGPIIRIEHTATGWEMTKPSKAKVDGTKIEYLLEITRAKSIRRFEATQDLKEYGLNPPLAVLTLNQTRIEMGTLHPMNQRRYMRVGTTIHLINDRFPHLLQAPADYYISTKKP
jgi:hypothetical protein